MLRDEPPQNIFFDLIDDAGTEVIWSKLKRRCPYLAHEHPSTIYTLACYIERKFSTIRHRTRWLRRPTPAIVAASVTLSAMIHNFFWHGAASSPIFHKILSDTDSSAYCTVTAC